MSDDEKQKLEQELEELRKEYDPYYQYIENFTQWSKHQQIKERMQIIKRRLREL